MKGSPESRYGKESGRTGSTHGDLLSPGLKPPLGHSSPSRSPGPELSSLELGRPALALRLSPLPASQERPVR